MSTRSRLIAAVAVTLIIIAGIIWNPFANETYAQTAPPTGYERLLLCQMPGATKAEAQYATGLTTLFAGTFTVRTRDWEWLTDAQMWYGEWWLRDQSGAFAWVPVGTNMTCSYYPAALDESWIERPGLP